MLRKVKGYIWFSAAHDCQETCNKATNCFHKWSGRSHLEECVIVSIMSECLQSLEQQPKGLQCKMQQKKRKGHLSSHAGQSPSTSLFLGILNLCFSNLMCIQMVRRLCENVHFDSASLDCSPTVSISNKLAGDVANLGLVFG